MGQCGWSRGCGPGGVGGHRRKSLGRRGGASERGGSQQRSAGRRARPGHSPPGGTREPQLTLCCACTAALDSGGLGPSLARSLRPGPARSLGQSPREAGEGGGLGPESSGLGGQDWRGPALRGGPQQGRNGTGRGWMYPAPPSHSPPAAPMLPCPPAVPQTPTTLPPSRLRWHTPDRHLGCGSFNAVFLPFSWHKLRPPHGLLHRACVYPVAPLGGRSLAGAGCGATSSLEFSPF